MNPSEPGTRLKRSTLFMVVLRKDLAFWTLAILLGIGIWMLLTDHEARVLVGVFIVVGVAFAIRLGVNIWLVRTGILIAGRIAGVGRSHGAAQEFHVEFQWGEELKTITMTLAGDEFYPGARLILLVGKNNPKRVRVIDAR